MHFLVLSIFVFFSVLLHDTVGQLDYTSDVCYSPTYLYKSSTKRVTFPVMKGGGVVLYQSDEPSSTIQLRCIHVFETNNEVVERYRKICNATKRQLQLCRSTTDPNEYEKANNLPFKEIQPFQKKDCLNLNGYINGSYRLHDLSFSSMNEKDKVYWSFQYSLSPDEYPLYCVPTTVHFLALFNFVEEERASRFPAIIIIIIVVSVVMLVLLVLCIWFCCRSDSCQHFYDRVLNRPPPLPPQGTSTGKDLFDIKDEELYAGQGPIDMLSPYKELETPPVHLDVQAKELVLPPRNLPRNYELVPPPGLSPSQLRQGSVSPPLAHLSSSPRSLPTIPLHSQSPQPPVEGSSTGTVSSPSFSPDRLGQQPPQPPLTSQSPVGRSLYEAGISPVTPGEMDEVFPAGNRNKSGSPRFISPEQQERWQQLTTGEGSGTAHPARYYHGEVVAQRIAAQRSPGDVVNDAAMEAFPVIGVDNYGKSPIGQDARVSSTTVMIPSTPNGNTQFGTSNSLRRRAPMSVQRPFSPQFDETSPAHTATSYSSSAQRPSQSPARVSMIKFDETNNPPVRAVPHYHNSVMEESESPENTTINGFQRPFGAYRPPAEIYSPGQTHSPQRCVDYGDGSDDNYSPPAPLSRAVGVNQYKNNGGNPYGNYHVDPTPQSYNTGKCRGAMPQFDEL